MASSKPTLAHLAAWLRRLAYVGFVALFLWACARFYLPGQGFTAFIEFSTKPTVEYLPELKAANYHAQRDYGYDAQYYAQIAMHPQLRDPVLKEAVDSLPYRARRILFCWTAYALGGGSPIAALNIYALQNVVAWLLLAWVLLRWFPPTNWGNFLRWFAVLFTLGLCFSIRAALVDGPSLLLIAVGMALLEAGRPWCSAAVLGVAGLGKETNILAGSIFAPVETREGRSWLKAIGRGALVVAPLGLWLVCLALWLGNGRDVGARNFDWPFLGYVRKWREAIDPYLNNGSHQLARTEILVMVALTVQWLYFALRPRWRDPWWRLGASYGLLMVVLGDAVWEGYPGAAARVLLPMTLAFNVSLPRGRRWWLVFLVGNLLVWPSPDALIPPGQEDSEVQGPQILKVDTKSGGEVRIHLDESEWYEVERSHFSYWRWAHGPATVRIYNPHPFAVTADITFALKSTDARNVTVKLGERELWRGPTEAVQPIVFRAMILAPGETVLQFDTDRPPRPSHDGDPRRMAYRIVDFRVTLLARAP